MSSTGRGATGSSAADGLPLGGREAVAGAMRLAQGYLLGRQSADGYWVGELEADASVTAGYVPLMYFMLGRVDAERQRKAVNYVRSRQNADGSWPAYHGGPGDLSVSVQAFLALKLAGVPPDDPSLERARRFILAGGGIGKVNVLTRIWLALFGQLAWGSAPSVPPEIIFLPNWFYLNIYEFSSWSRATIMALSIVLTQKPLCPIPEHARIDELYLEPPGQRKYALGRAGGLLSWQRLFLVLDSLLKAYDRLPLQPGRKAALRQVARWVVEHQEADGSWGGIMLPWVYSLIGLRSLGYANDHPVMARGLQGLEGFIAEDTTTMRLQPATSPVWDTAWAVIALRESGLPADDPALCRAARWLLGQEIRAGGDWRVKNPTTEPGGWAFEFYNDQYPDLDDTALVARALRRVQLPAEDEAAKEAAIGRGLRWAASMQCRDGGWAAFDLDNDRQILAHIPFADFMTPLDPTCADVTAHVVDLLAELAPDSPALHRALEYLAATQEDDGAWYGRWGVNYVYGTGLVLCALGAVGVAAGDSRVQRAATWLAWRQNVDGGWGESCRSYDDPSRRGHGPSTPSQTAWALAGLLAAGEGRSRAVRRGIQYLLERQGQDGAWAEEAYTGTGFPRAFYLRYDLYRAYFPLLVLSRYYAGLEETSS